MKLGLLIPIVAIMVSCHAFKLPITSPHIQDSSTYPHGVVRVAKPIKGESMNRWLSRVSGTYNPPLKSGQVNDDYSYRIGDDFDKWFKRARVEIISDPPMSTMEQLKKWYIHKQVSLYLDDKKPQPIVLNQLTKEIKKTSIDAVRLNGGPHIHPIVYDDLRSADMKVKKPLTSQKVQNDEPQGPPIFYDDFDLADSKVEKPLTSQKEQNDEPQGLPIFYDDFDLGHNKVKTPMVVQQVQHDEPQQAPIFYDDFNLVYGKNKKPLTSQKVQNDQPQGQPIFYDDFDFADSKVKTPMVLQQVQHDEPPPAPIFYDDFDFVNENDKKIRPLPVVLNQPIEPEVQPVIPRQPKWISDDDHFAPLVRTQHRKSEIRTDNVYHAPLLRKKPLI